MKRNEIKVSRKLWIFTAVTASQRSTCSTAAVVSDNFGVFEKVL